jgi:hypothetical protein
MSAIPSRYVNLSGFTPDTLFLVLDVNRLHPEGRDEWENWKLNLLSPGLHVAAVASYSLAEEGGGGVLENCHCRTCSGKSLLTPYYLGYSL